tara:strand:- start:2054 stop:2440 length:387 start_codon:yes stop_codon:yes gene_type:complete
MTCFWDSITSSLLDEDYKILGINRNREKLILKLKEKNKIVNTLWQGKQLSQKEKHEHFDAIKSYNIAKINNGHLTSICDSFLLLICDLLKITIEHRFLNITIIYTSHSHSNSRKTLRFKSNNHHFWRE